MRRRSVWQYIADDAEFLCISVVLLAFLIAIVATGYFWVYPVTDTMPVD